MGSRVRGSGGFWSNAKPGGGSRGMKSGASGTYPSDSSEEGVRRSGWGARNRWTYNSWAKVAQAAGAYACQRGICFLGSSGGGLPNTVMRTRAMPSRCRKAGKAFGTGGKGPERVGFGSARMDPWRCRW